MCSDRGRERDWLADIVENIDRIASHVGDMTFEAFEPNALVGDAVERCVERIIEASIRIGPDRMREISPDLPLHKVRGLGNRLRHEYELIDPRIIWETIVDELPALRVACERILENK